MNLSFRAWWLIIAACVALHLSVWYTVVVLVVYTIADIADRRRRLSLRAKMFDDVLAGWKPCKDDPNMEEKDEWTRVRLVGQNPIVVSRLMELLSRIE